MTNRDTRPDPRAVGSYRLGAVAPNTGARALHAALLELGRDLSIVSVSGELGVAQGGTVQLGTPARGDALPLHAWVPALTAEALGDASFRADYGVRLAYVAGEMANGIASEELVIAVARAGMLGVFGAAGLPLPRVREAIARLRESLGDGAREPGEPRDPLANGAPAWGVNLIHSPDDPRLEDALVSLFIGERVRFVSASAFLDLTLPIVRYRVTGLRRDPSGRVVAPNRVMAKVSRVEVARKFFAPPPEEMLRALVSQGSITAEEAALAREVPMADDVTAEADSGGHTDNRPLVLLLPALVALRDELQTKHAYYTHVRVGAAGGLATPASVSAAFAMGAAYVVTGSVNQGCREAGTSDVVRQMLADCAPTDVAMAPAADMFEMGVKVQVLSRGTLFAVRAARLYELYRAHDSIASLPATARAELEQKYFRETLEEAWEGCRAFFAERDPSQLARAAREPKHKLALLFRAYLGQASRWANEGRADRKLDFQIWCGPSMGAFNAWARGSFLERWEARGAVVVAENLMTGAAYLTRVAAVRAQGIPVPAELAQFAPRTRDELAALSAPAVVDIEAPHAQEPKATPGPNGVDGNHAANGANGATLAGTLEASRTTESRAKGREEPIAIVGMGGLYPNAENLHAFWRLLRTGKDAITDIPATHWSLADYYDADPKAADKTYAKRGAFIGAHAFDPTEFGIPPAILEATDTSQLLGLVAARMAMDDAGYGEHVAWDRTRASVLLGVTGTQELVITLGSRLGHPRWRKALLDSGIDAALADEVVARISQSYVGWQENSFPGLLGNVVAGRIANRLDFGGTNCVIDAACASSLGAVHLAVLELRSGKSDLVLTGGVDSLNDIFMHMCFSKTPALSASGDVRPFSDDADGTLLGEAMGMLVLKRLSDAERDNDRIYATIRGLGTSSDGRAKSIYAPLPKGQARAIRAAYREANVRPRDIDMLEAHGTGTKAGDLAEVTALDLVFREDSADPAWCALGSVKSQIGHTKAAAGAVGMTKAALALHHKVLLPTIKVLAPNAAMNLDESPFTISTETRPWLRRAEGPRLAALSSFGFGGTNFHLVLEEHGSARTAPAWDSAVDILALSDASAAGLVAQAEAAASSSSADLAALARASRAEPAEKRAANAHRLLCVLHEDVDAAALLRAAAAKISAAPAQAFSLPDGAHYGVGAAPGSLAFLFPGQGAQHVNMLRELACIFPEMLAAVESAGDVAPMIYPAPTFDAEERARREERLTRTNVAQPALAAVERGLLEVLARFGVKPAIVAGHSFGELTALHAAGVLGPRSLSELSRLRGTLMAGNGEDRGTMLAVLAKPEDIERVIATEKLDVVLANRNGPEQGVLSGARAAIDRAEAACHAKGLRTARLSVGAAFHSPLVADAAKSFREGLSPHPFGAPRIPVIANTTAEEYPEDAQEARGLLGAQLAKPVQFDRVILRMAAKGARTFLEVGPRATLSGMVRATLADTPHAAIATDAQSKRGGLFDLATALCRLAALGHRVDLAPWQDAARAPRESTRPARKPKMVVPLTGANHRDPVAPIPVRAKPQAQATAPTSESRPANPSTPASAHSHATFREVSMSDVPRNAPPPDAVLELLRANQAAVSALQAQQEQTARIHQTFLEGQLHAQQSFHALLTGQRDLTHAVLGQAAPQTTVAALPRTSPLPTTAAPALTTAPAVAPAHARAEHLPASRAPAVASPVAPAPSLEDASPKVAVSHAHASVDARAALFAVVAQTTGYPEETLEVGMDMEADLGIDSIKRVEILSLLSKRVPGAPSVNPEKLGALRTLQQVIDFIGAAAPGNTRPEGTAASHTNGARAEHDANRANGANGASSANEPRVDVISALVDVVSQTTGYPKETLELGMDMEADLGIDSIKRVEILSLLSKRVPHAPSVNPEKLGALRTLQQVVDFIGGAASASSAPPAGRAATSEAAPNATSSAASTPSIPSTPTSNATAFSADATIVTHRVTRRVVRPTRLPARADAPPVFPSSEIVVQAGHSLSEALVLALVSRGARARLFSSAAEITGPVGGLVAFAPEGAGWTASEEKALKGSIELARAFGPRLCDAGAAGPAFFAAVSVRDGAFGHASVAPSQSPLAGGVAGLAKTAAHEWPAVRCLALDVAHGLPLSDAARELADELGSPRVSDLHEVGLGPGGRVTLSLDTAAATNGAIPLQRGDVVVVTGGARGVTATCARALALEAGAKLLLLGRSPLPEEEPSWMAAATDEASLKRALLEHAPPGEKPTPKMLGERARGVTAAREVRHSLSLLETSGIAATYRAVDVRDEHALASVLADARATLGPVRGIVHGAGVLRDKRIEDKRDADIDDVVDTKLAGLRALLAATRADDLAVLALFASVSGRFGRRGQSDYALANQALVSVAQVEAAARPRCRVVALDWGPWDGGMVTPALKNEFHREGIALIPLEEGARAMVSELRVAPAGPSEVVLGAGFGAHEGAEDAPPPFVLSRVHHLDPATHPILADHRLAGKSVLPFALSLEWMAEAVMRVHGASCAPVLTDARVLRGLTMGAAPEDVCVWLRPEGEHAFTVELRNAKDAVLVRATARFRDENESGAGTDTFATSPFPEPGDLAPHPLTVQRIYATQLFHGKCLAAITDISGISAEGMVLSLRAHATSEDLLPAPLRTFVLGPLTLDGVFQALIVWCRKERGAPSLPARIARLTPLRPFGETGTVRAVVRVREVDGAVVIADVDLTDARGVVMRIEGYACTVSASLDRAFHADPEASPSASALLG